MSQLNYVANQNDQYEGFTAMPAGEYKVQIADTNIAPPKSGDGEMLSIVYEIVADPQFDGRKVFDNIMLEHSKADTVRIGKQKLNTVCVLTGVKALKDTAQLHGKTLTLLLGVKMDHRGNDANFIKKYLPFNSEREDEEQEQSESPAVNRKPSFIKK